MNPRQRKARKRREAFWSGCFDVLPKESLDHHIRVMRQCIKMGGRGTIWHDVGGMRKEDWAIWAKLKKRKKGDA